MAGFTQKISTLDGARMLWSPLGWELTCQLDCNNRREYAAQLANPQPGIDPITADTLTNLQHKLARLSLRPAAEVVANMTAAAAA